ncbi:type II toxin-antitoxin system death-on-curing family toxin [Myroides odoratimimus]|uniref:type II toxin-antitoxin system death-on-curing family toxin n=1 Tax=Myroides odoratimimus TaxID=76832 RepID=UPI003F439532
MKFEYFDLEHAIEVQEYIIKNSGGLKGVRDKGAIDSILEHVKNDMYYPSLEAKVCHIFFSFNKIHAFSDGNKRSAITLSAYFLEINGAGFIVNKYIQEMENITVYVADNKIDKDLLYEIIVEILYCMEFSESLKLQIARAIMPPKINEAIF